MPNRQAIILDCGMCHLPCSLEGLGFNLGCKPKALRNPCGLLLEDLDSVASTSNTLGSAAMLVALPMRRWFFGHVV